MAKPLKLELSEKQRQELEGVRDHDPRPYLRERAGALLKIAAGQSGRAVAQHGLLRPRYPEAVYRWYQRYQASGIQGLAISPGAGRKPAFSP
jgi:hypothetical protein